MNVPTAIAADVPVLLREREKDVAILVLNRPNVRNSLSEAKLIALSSALGDIAADNTVRAVVLAANGPAFCAGHDLKELTSRRSDADGGRAYFPLSVDWVTPSVASEDTPRSRPFRPSSRGLSCA